jgi:hypothetical protein
MANLKVMSALAISAALAVATPAMAQRVGGGGFHGGGGGGFHGGGGGMHAGGFGGGMRAGGTGGGFRAAAIGGGAPRAAFGNSGFRNANASALPSSNGFAGRGAVVAGGGGRNWNGGGWRHGYRPGIGFAAGLAAGSALGYGYGGYYDDGYYADNGYYGDPYAYNDGYYGTGDSGYVVSSNDDSGSCAQRYRSYDPASGTYLGYDGQRHPCP